MRHLDLFSGIGGFALAARWVGWETVGFCEINPYCQKVLKKHWPKVPIYDDIKTYTGTAGTADIITGGFPCQDISSAGKGAGIDGERSGLWTDLARIIGEVQPRYAVLENVSTLLSGDSGRWFQRVLGDLASIGYDCEWHCIPASAIGAPHRRDRVWIIAYPVRSRVRANARAQSRTETECTELQQENRQALPNDAETIRQAMAHTTGRRWNNGQRRLQSQILQTSRDSYYWNAEPNVGRVANGVPRRVDRLRGLGNAIVPQIAEIIFRAINDQYPQKPR